MNFLKKIINKPVTISMIVLVMLILGVFSTKMMPVTLLPDLNIPFLGVTVVYPGANASTVEEEVTTVLEAGLGTISKVTEVRSYSIENASIVILSFEYETSLEKKQTEIKEKISTISLPDTCREPVISEIDFNSNAVASIAFTTDSNDLTLLKKDAEMIKQKIELIDGVGSVVIKGIPEEQLIVSPIKGLEMVSLLVVQSLSEKQLDIPLGSVSFDGNKIAIRNSSSANELKELAKTTIAIPQEKAIWDSFEKYQTMINQLFTYVKGDELTKYIDLFNNKTIDEMESVKISILQFKDKIDAIPDTEYDEKAILLKYAPIFKVYGFDLTKEILTIFKQSTKTEIENIFSSLISAKEKNLVLSYDLLNFIKNIDFTAITYNGNIGTYITPLLNVNEKEEELELTPNIVSINLLKTSDSYSFYNDHLSVILEVYQKAQSNTSKIVKDVKKVINDNKSDSFQMNLLEDQAEFIDDSISNVLSSMIIGGVLAIIVIFLFLRKVRSSLVIAITMPLSVLSSLIILYLLGVTLNMVSLGGLAVGIGMLVDNSIVVIEAITKKRENEGKNVVDAAHLATKDVAPSLFASTLTTVCVFIPIMFTKGLTKEIFTDLSLAVILSLVNSLLVAIFVIPTLYVLFYKNKQDKEDKQDKFTKWLEGKYQKLLEKALTKKLLVVLSLVIIFLLSSVLVVTRGIEFLPPSDKGTLEVTLDFDSLTSIEDATSSSKVVYDLIKGDVDNIQEISMKVGKLGLIPINISGAITIKLNEKHKKTSLVKEEISNLLKENNISGTVKEIDGIVASITSGFNDLSVTINGKDEQTLIKISQELEDALLKSEGITKVTNNLTSLQDEYHLDIDKTKCQLYGVDYQNLVKMLRVGLAGYEVDSVFENNDKLNVLVKFNDSTIVNKDSLLNLGVGFSSDKVITLKDICEIKETKEKILIVKDDGNPSLQLTIETFGIDTGTASKIINKSTKEVLKNYEGYNVKASGVQAYLTDAFEGLVVSLIIAVFLLYAVMACQFESLTRPLIIMASIPLTFTGAFFALTISNVTLNIVSFIGIIMLMGVIVNNAIIMLDEIKRLKEELHLEEYDAVLKGCTNRLRPILMTSLTTILAVVPLSLGLGRGGELMQPMGIVVIGGLLLGTIVTLFLIPCIFCGVRKIKK